MVFSRTAQAVLRGARTPFRGVAVRGIATNSARQPTRSLLYAALGGATLASLYPFLASCSNIENEAAVLAGVKGTSSERTFIAVKPDGVQRGLVGEVITRFEKRGYKLVGLKLLVPSKELAKEHYADLSSKPFFNGLVDYMTNGKAPVVGMVWEGLDVIKQGRAMIGATNPLAANPGTIRGDNCISVGRNIIHGSDSFESACIEIKLWFGKPGEVVDWTSALAEWVTSNN